MKMVVSLSIIKSIGDWSVINVKLNGFYDGNLIKQLDSGKINLFLKCVNFE
jgi:uncharacterized protein YutD